MTRMPVRLSIACLLALTASLAAQTRYFPPETFGDDPRLDQFVYGWYSRELKAMGEPSLFESSKNPAIESYRFLWLRSFHHPVVVRVDLQTDGSATLITKLGSGAGGYPPGKLIANRSRLLTKEELQTLIAHINASGFWQRPSYERNKAGTDGAEWVVEAAVRGKYHLVSEWSPKDGPIHDLGLLFLFQLAELDIPKSEIY